MESGYSVRLPQGKALEQQRPRGVSLATSCSSSAEFPISLNCLPGQAGSPASGRMKLREGADPDNVHIELVPGPVRLDR